MGNPFSVFSKDPKNMPGQGLANADNYRSATASTEYGKLIQDLYGNQGYMLGQEQQYNPQWLAQQQAQAQQANTGALSLYGGNVGQLGQYQARADTYGRTSQLNDFANLGASGLQAYQSINPQQAALYSSLLGQANQQVALGSQLRPEDQYRISSGVRGDFANRGLGNSNAAQLSEAMGLYGAGEQMYQKRLASAQQLGGAASAYYSPLYAALMQQSAVPGQAQQFTQYANQLGSNAGPTQYNAATSAGLLNNVYSQNQSNNRTTADLETKVGMDQANKWNQWLSLGVGAMCWAARELFGETNPKWRQFRGWMLTEAPAALREWYRENGEALADALHTASPADRQAVRRWMESKI